MRLAFYACISPFIAWRVIAGVCGDECADIAEVRIETETLKADSESGHSIFPDEVIILVNDGNDSSSREHIPHDLQHVETDAQPSENTGNLPSIVSVIVQGSDSENHVMELELSQTVRSDIKPDGVLDSDSYSSQQEETNDFEMMSITTLTTTIASKPTKLSHEAVCLQVCRRTPGCYSDQAGSSTYCKTWQNPQVCYGLYWKDASLTTTCYHLYDSDSEYCPERWPVMCDGPIVNSRSTTPDSRTNFSTVASDTMVSEPHGSATLAPVGSPMESEEFDTGPQENTIDESQTKTADGGVQPGCDSSKVEVIVHNEIPPNDFDGYTVATSSQPLSVRVNTTPTVATESSTYKETRSVETIVPSSTQPLIATQISTKLTSGEADTNLGNAGQISVIVHSTDNLTSPRLRKWKTCQALCDTLEVCKGSFGSTCLLNNRNQQQSCYGLFYTDTMMSRMCYAPKDMNCPNDYPVPCP